MKLITRTISEQKYDVICLNIKTAEVTVKSFSLGSMNPTTEKKTLDALKSLFDTDEIKLVNIQSRRSEDVLYAMTEQAFIKNAVPVNDIKEAREYFKKHPEDGEEVESVEC